MSALLFQTLQFFDAEGINPLANGKVYFFEADGTTPQAAYTNAAGNVPLANPTILDAGGRPNNGGGIWLDIGLTYTIVIRDSDDAVVMTLDDVAAVNAGIAPNNASYVTMTAEASLTNERVLTGTANQITVTDNASTAVLSLPFQVNLGSSATGSSELRLFEDTDNGSNMVTLTVPSSIASNATVTLPATTGTVYVSGGTDVAIADGGTGQSTAVAAFDALAPTTTQGDIIYHNGTDNVRLGAGANFQALTAQGAGTNPIYRTVPVVLSSSTVTGGPSTQFRTIATGVAYASNVAALKLVVKFTCNTSAGTDTLYLQTDTAGGTTWTVSGYANQYVGNQGTGPTGISVGTTTGIGIVVHPLYGTNSAEGVAEFTFSSVGVYHASGTAYNNVNGDNFVITGSNIIPVLSIGAGGSISFRLAAGTANTSVAVNSYSITAIF